MLIDNCCHNVAVIPFLKQRMAGHHTTIGCTPETLRGWVNRIEVDSGKRAGVTTDAAAKIKQLERENKELKQANEILKKAAAFFVLPFRQEERSFLSSTG